MSGAAVARPRRIVAVSLNAAIDKTASVPRLVPGEIHRPRLLAVVPGGKAVNVARAARHLGVPASAIPIIGGHAGAWYLDELQAAGITATPVDVSGETRTCLSVLDESTGRLTEFYESGVRLTDADWSRVEGSVRDALREDPAGTVVVLAGSLPPGAPGDAYARLGRLAATAGARWVADVEGGALRLALAARPWLAKVNAREAHELLGEDDRPRAADLVRLARGLVSLGAVTAIVTDASEGAALAGADGEWRLQPAPGRGPFGVGSGDAFLAGYVAGLARGLSAPDALRLAGGTGVANAMVPGQGQLDPAEAERLADASTATPVGGPPAPP